MPSKLSLLNCLLAFCLSIVFAPNLSAEPDFSSVDIETIRVADGVYMLRGAGGNIGLSIGKDGVFVIDDQYAPLATKIKTAIAGLSNKPVRFVVNTHWHPDHTGGNESLGHAGATIVAHHNVRARLQKGQLIKALDNQQSPAPKAALPVLTFDEGVNFHWNQQTIEVQHIESAHTDGDAIVFFKEANVVHMGDLYFNGFYPFIDASSGGSLQGLIAGVDQVLTKIKGNTRLIPGHGKLSNKTELQTYRDMLVTVHQRLSALRAQGKSDEEIIALKPIADLDKKWGNGFLSSAKWLRIVLSVM